MEVGLQCPFTEFDKLFSEHHSSWDLLVVDFHAEATSEKMAFGHYQIILKILLVFYPKSEILVQN
jgi:calcineurin-like phosphoesterase